MTVVSTFQDQIRRKIQLIQVGPYNPVGKIVRPDNDISLRYSSMRSQNIAELPKERSRNRCDAETHNSSFGESVSVL